MPDLREIQELSADVKKYKQHIPVPWNFQGTTYNLNFFDEVDLSDKVRIRQKRWAVPLKFILYIPAKLFAG